MQVAVEMRQLVRRQIRLDLTRVLARLVALVHKVLESAQQRLQLVGACLIRFEEIAPVFVGLALFHVHSMLFGALLALASARKVLRVGFGSHIACASGSDVWRGVSRRSLPAHPVEGFTRLFE